MLELLELCGFEAAEAKKELPRIEKAFNKLGITLEDIETGKRRLNKYYDVKLKGVRKIFRLCILELVGSVLAREDGKKKVIFGLMSPGFETIGSVLVSNFKDVFTSHLSWAYLVVAGCIFDKIKPVLEAAESRWLKAGMVSHCGNVKTFLGLFTLEMMPQPDMMVSAGFSCETAPKTLDLLGEFYNIPIYCIDTCQDRELIDYTGESKRTISLAMKSLKKLIEQLQKTIGFELTDNMFLEVLNVRDKFNTAFGKLREVMENNDPMPIKATHDTLLMALNSLSLSIDGLEEATDALNTLREELQDRVNNGVGAVEKGAPRILGVLPDHHADPRFEYLIGEMGMALVATDPGFMVPYSITSQDPYEVMSLNLMQSLATSLPRRIPLIIEGCRKLHINGVINRYHVGCRSVTADTVLIGDAIKRELDIPVLSMEWENFDSRAYNHEQYKRTLDVFKTMVEDHKNRLS